MQEKQEFDEQKGLVYIKMQTAEGHKECCVLKEAKLEMIKNESLNLLLLIISGEELDFDTIRKSKDPGLRFLHGIISAWISH